MQNVVKRREPNSDKKTSLEIATGVPGQDTRDLPDFAFSAAAASDALVTRAILRRSDQIQCGWASVYRLKAARLMLVCIGGGDRSGFFSARVREAERKLWPSVKRPPDSNFCPGYEAERRAAALLGTVGT